MPASIFTLGSKRSEETKRLNLFGTRPIDGCTVGYLHEAAFSLSSNLARLELAFTPNNGLDEFWRDSVAGGGLSDEVVAFPVARGENRFSKQIVGILGVRI